MTGEVTKEDGGAVSLEDLRQKMVDFAKERDWEKYHSPRNLLLALVGEVGELSECFQWKGEVPKGLPDWKEEEKQHLGEELSDVLLYLVQLSYYYGIDLGKAALRKVHLNVIKHHVNRYIKSNIPEENKKSDDFDDDANITNQDNNNSNGMAENLQN
ncbi:hypothetical protein MKW98_028412 [Papaver atlanticum]|uniref:dCTP pyrophosphatase 1 n=1 Tax=Papaver atlanticum TaxID=357466 RepID=A0AAD4XNG0_9MAGN|nr:hypothetical protein MKW98_028412 [Papaver atlanticum]